MFTLRGDLVWLLYGSGGGGRHVATLGLSVDEGNPLPVGLYMGEVGNPGGDLLGVECELDGVHPEGEWVVVGEESLPVELLDFFFFFLFGVAGASCDGSVLGE